MRPEADAGGQRQHHRTAHQQRVAGMKAAGDVGGADDAQQLVVAAHSPGAEAFAEISVEIDPAHHQFLSHE
jgi:hypothetical protein